MSIVNVKDGGKGIIKPTFIRFYRSDAVIEVTNRPDRKVVRARANGKRQTIKTPDIPSGRSKGRHRVPVCCKTIKSADIPPTFERPLENAGHAHAYNIARARIRTRYLEKPRIISRVRNAAAERPRRQEKRPSVTFCAGKTHVRAVINKRHSAQMHFADVARLLNCRLIAYYVIALLRYTLLIREIVTLS